MRTRRFGWTGVAVPVIGQGTWHMERDGATRAAAADLDLSPEEIARLDAAFPLGAPPRTLPVL